MHKIKELNFEKLNNISEKQISEHHDVLYAGYVNKLNEIEDLLSKSNRETANGTYGEFRELKKEEVFATNGKQLHEDYFDGLGGDGEVPDDVKNILKEYFGSYQEWEKDFKACGLASRGWVVLAYNWADEKMHNYICDSHDMGGVWGATPLLVLDVYEHAYFLDYATNRKKYIDDFMSNLNWGQFLNRWNKIKNIKMNE